MRTKRLCLILAALAFCVVAVVSLGCESGGILTPPDDDGNNDDPPINGDAVALGDMRQLQDGDTWTYQVTGTFVPAGGGASALTPADAVVTYTVPAAAAADTAQIPGASLWSVEVPLQYGGTSEVHENVAAVSQGANRQLFLEGYSPAPGMLPVVPMVGGPLAGPDPAGLAALNDWSASGEVQGFGALTIDFTNEGMENVTVPAGTFASYHGTGEKSLGGYFTDYEAWVNPQLGCYVKMTTTWEMGTGALTITHELKSTNVPVT